jgi:hypothetical protein
MMMDDLGALIWRFGKKLIVSHAESDELPRAHHADPHVKAPVPPPSRMSPAAE